MATQLSEFGAIRRQPRKRQAPRTVTGARQIDESTFDPSRMKSMLPGLGGRAQTPVVPSIQPVQPPAQPVQPVAQPQQPAVTPQAPQAAAPIAAALPQAPQQPPVQPSQPIPGVGSSGITGLPAGPNVTEFTAEENLRNKQIAPGGDPSRSALAQQTFDLIREQGEAGFQADIRKVGQSAAKFGRIGAGMTTSDLGDVAQRRNEFLGRAQRDLALRTAGEEFADRRSNRGELRTERSYQGGLAQQSIENARRQRLDEDFLKGSEFGRQFDVSRLAGDLGRGGNANELLSSTDLLPEGVSTFDFLQEAALKRAREGQRPQVSTAADRTRRTRALRD